MDILCDVYSLLRSCGRLSEFDADDRDNSLLFLFSSSSDNPPVIYHTDGSRIWTHFKQDAKDVEQVSDVIYRQPITMEFLDFIIYLHRQFGNYHNSSRQRVLLTCLKEYSFKEYRLAIDSSAYVGYTFHLCVHDCLFPMRFMDDLRPYPLLGAYEVATTNLPYPNLPYPVRSLLIDLFVKRYIGIAMINDMRSHQCTEWQPDTQNLENLEKLTSVTETSVTETSVQAWWSSVDQYEIVYDTPIDQTVLTRVTRTDNQVFRDVLVAVYWDKHRQEYCQLSIINVSMYPIFRVPAKSNKTKFSRLQTCTFRIEPVPIHACLPSIIYNHRKLRLFNLTNTYLSNVIPPVLAQIVATFLN